MLGDGTLRGATLEACITKIKLSAGNYVSMDALNLLLRGFPLYVDIQLIGMSATLSNIAELATFLRAEVYTSDFRPVCMLTLIACFIV